MGFLLFGGPGETKETANESLEFADSLDLERTHDASLSEYLKSKLTAALDSCIRIIFEKIS